MTGVSGCFGRPNNEPIDDIQDAAAAVNDIVSGEDPAPADTSAETLASVAAVVGEYTRRVRLLTWAVVIIALVLVLKEVD